MIRVDTRPLAPDVRWALDVLIDLTALLIVTDPAADVVTVSVGDGRGVGHDVSRNVRHDVGLTIAGARARGWGVRRSDVIPACVAIDEDVLRLIARVASAGDEQHATEYDRHGRVPSSVNVLVRERAERTPVLHEAARAVCEAVERAAGARPVRYLARWPDGRSWAAAVTHDLDVVAAWPAFAALRWAELLRGGHAALAARAVAAAAASALASPVERGVAEILDVEATHGVRATWFVLCGTPTLRTVRAGDLTYRPESPRARRILARVRDGGHEIGLHGSFATGDDAACMAAERGRLAARTGAEVRGVRQHFLRMRPGATQRVMAAAGFCYDATFGFPDRNGFRLGAADVLPGYFDTIRAETVPVDVVPLVWMDRALSKYRGVELPDAWIDDALDLAATVRAVGGLWTGLWHPNLTPALGYPGAPAAFARLVASLVSEQPYTASLGELVTWRAARRAVRVSALAPDLQRVSFAAPADPRIRIVDRVGLEDRALTRALQLGGDHDPG